MIISEFGFCTICQIENQAGNRKSVHEAIVRISFLKNNKVIGPLDGVTLNLCQYHYVRFIRSQLAGVQDFVDDVLLNKEGEEK